MKRLIIYLFIIIGVICIASKKKSDQPKVEIVFCLDISRSTDGLMSIFKNQIWETINIITEGSTSPEVSVGVIAYGQPVYGREHKYIKTFSPLTTDIDVAFQELMELNIVSASAGSNPGTALAKCLKEMHWTKGEKTDRIVFWMGNGSIKNDLDLIKKQCKKAQKKKIVINAVYIDVNSKMENKSDWKQVAEWGGGIFESISHHDIIASGKESFTEDMLIDAGELMNDTYIHYGVSGFERKAILDKIDALISNMSKTAQVQRTIYKASDHYQGLNYKWDLVDFSSQPEFDVAKIDRKLLPENWRKLADEMLLERIMKKREDREEIIQIVRMLGKKAEDKHVQHMDVEEVKKPISMKDIFITTFDSLPLYNELAK